MTEPKNVTRPKGLDSFQASIYTALQWVTKNQKALMLVTLPVIAVLIGGFAWSFYAAKQKEVRQTELAKIDMKWQDEAKVMDTKRQSMQKLIDILPGANKEKNSKEKPNAETERKTKEIQEQMAALTAEHTESIAAYNSFYKKNEDNAEGWVAGMRVAADAIKHQKYDEADAILTKILSKSVSKPFYQVQGRMLQMALLEEKGEFQKAIEVADTLIKMADKELVPVVLLDKGRLQWLNNAKADAVATLDTIVKDHGSSPEADKARGLRALL